MGTQSNIGARMDRLPTSKWLMKVFWLISLGIFVDGFDNYMGGMVLAELVKSGWSDNYWNAIFNSVTMAGLFVGSLLAGFTGDALGRRWAYQVNLLIFGVASIAAAFASDMLTLVALRGIIGVGLGAELVVGFATFTEFVPAKTRGKWCGTLSFVANTAPPITAMVAYLVIPLYGWRAMFMIAGVAAMILWVARHGLAESPRWHASRGDLVVADEILSKVEREIEQQQGIKLPPVEAKVETVDVVVEKVPFTNLFKGHLLRTTILGISVLVAMNTAIYSIMNWIPTIFVQSGISITKTLGLTALMFCGAPLGVFLTSRIIDRFPRKATAVTMLLSLAVMVYVYSLQRDETMIVAFGFVMTVVLYMYVCFASAVYVPEMWPTHIRLRGSGFCNAIGRLVTVFTPFGVAWILSNYGSIAVFATIAGILCVSALIIAFLGIETRKRSLEEIGRVSVDDDELPSISQVVPEKP